MIKYLHIGIDDTDSPDGMCTTYLASQIINRFNENGIELVDYPRLIRCQGTVLSPGMELSGVLAMTQDERWATRYKEVVEFLIVFF